MSDAIPDAKQVFLKALEQKSPEELLRYLDEACADNAELRSRVEQLLRAHREVGDFLGGPPSAGATIAQPITEKPGTVIGPYKLLQKIGEGGFGVVYMAEQTEPVKRRVALKIIKPGMDTRQVIARFEAERQALAMMDHPNIAKVHDAGATESGRPYFVMELVKGIPITEYCDREHLTPKERLELFIPICQAVQHAHQKGVIHRDIKPTNVLVALYDGRPVPKVIDFGVAKATSKRLTEKTVFTHFGQIVGTLEYMSPEQAELNQLDIDTRSDVYSLGVLLYELLTGETPFDRQRLRSAAFDEMLRIIREEEPPRPSLRLSGSESLPSIAANRKIEPKKLSTLVRGELDWIVMKALEKDRSRRYETATSFSADIERYLSDEPVQACPPSAAYRLRKFARRNKTALFTVAVVVAALLVGIAGTTWEAIRATRALGRAVEAEGAARSQADRANREYNRANHEADNAKREAAIAQAVNEFINNDLLAQADPLNEPDREIKLRTVVDRAAEKVTGRFEAQPLVEAAIRHTLSRTYLGLGQHDEAERHARRALEIRRRELGSEHPSTLESMSGLADVCLARPQMHVYFFPSERLHVRHGVAERTFSKATKLYKEAEKLYKKVMEISARVRGPDDPSTLASMSGLAHVYANQLRYDEAENLLKQVLEDQKRVLGPEHSNTLLSMARLATVYTWTTRFAEAETLHNQLLTIRRRVLGPEHPHTIASMSSLASTANLQGRLDEAAELLKQVIEIRRRTLGEEHRSTVNSMRNLRRVYEKQGRYDDMEHIGKQLLDIHRRAFGDVDPRTLGFMDELGDLYWKLERYEDVEKLRREALDIRRQTLGPLDWDTVCTLQALRLLGRHWKDSGVAHYQAGAWEAAVQSLERAGPLLEEGDCGHRLFLAMAYWKTGDQDRARDLYAQGAAWFEARKRPYDLYSIDVGLEPYSRPGLPEQDRKRLLEEAGQLMGITEQDRTRLVEDYYEQQVEAKPNDGQVWIERGAWHGEKGLYDKAMEDYTEAIRRDPALKSSPLLLESMFANAASLLLADRQDEFNEFCHAANGWFAESADVRTQYLLARMAGLASRPPIEPERMVQLAERAIGGWPSSWRTHTQGLCLLRNGQLQEAVKELGHPHMRSWPADPVNWLAMAIAQHHAGDHAGAAQWLEKAQQWIEKNPLDLTSKLHPHDRLAGQVLLREAESLIDQSSESSNED